MRAPRWPRCARVAAALAVLFAAEAAGARTAAAQAPEASVPPGPGPSSGDEPWRAYDDAFRMLAEGRRSEALRAIADLVAHDPGHPAARRASELLALQPGATTPPPAEAVEDILHEEPTRAARAELASFQTFHGIAVGIEVCLLVDCSGAGSGLAITTLLGGAGLGAALVATQDGIRPGTTALLDSGVEWGAWNGVAISVAGDFHNHGVAASLLLGQGLGLGAGGALAAALKPTAGQVSLASTFGLWAGLLTVFARGADDFAGSRQSNMLSFLAASDAGLLGGAFFAAHFPVSRGHALLIDAGGAGGALLALGTVALVGGNGTRGQTYLLAMIPGTLVGLGASAYLTRNWDAPHLPVDVALTPLPDGRGAAAVVGGRF